MCHVQTVILLDIFLDSVVKPLLQLSLLLLKPRLLDLRVLQESFLSSLIRLRLRPVNLLQLAFLERVDLFIAVEELKPQQVELLGHLFLSVADLKLGLPGDLLHLRDDLLLRDHVYQLREFILGDLLQVLLRELALQLQPEELVVRLFGEGELHEFLGGHIGDFLALVDESDFPGEFLVDRVKRLQA